MLSNLVFFVWSYAFYFLNGSEKVCLSFKICQREISKPVPYSFGVIVVVVYNCLTAKFVDNNGQQGELLSYSQTEWKA